jgi:hypothetical protein
VVDAVAVCLGTFMLLLDITSRASISAPAGQPHRRQSWQRQLQSFDVVLADPDIFGRNHDWLAFVQAYLHHERLVADGGHRPHRRRHR